MPKNKFKKKTGSSLVERKKALHEAARSVRLEDEREAVKDKPSYSIKELLDKAEDCIDRFEYEIAQKFCQRALEIEPDHIRALETVGSLLLEAGDTEGAKQCFGRAVEVQPNAGHAKYMYLGQLFKGAQAVQCFQKGIQLMIKEKEEKEVQEVAAACREHCDITSRDISNGYCSVAEIYMTDCCFDADAEEKCRMSVEAAIDTDQHNPEAYQLQASFLLSTGNKQEAIEGIKKSVSLWLPMVQAFDKGDVSDEDFDPIEAVPLTYETRVAAGKILIEVEEYEMAIDVLESLLDEDDEVPSVWYMLGWSNYLQGPDFKENARYYLQKAHQVYKKEKYEDEELLEHITKLMGELGPGTLDDEAENGACDEDPESSDEVCDEECMEH